MKRIGMGIALGVIGIAAAFGITPEDVTRVVAVVAAEEPGALIVELEVEPGLGRAVVIVGLDTGRELYLSVADRAEVIDREREPLGGDERRAARRLRELDSVVSIPQLVRGARDKIAGQLPDQTIALHSFEYETEYGRLVAELEFRTEAPDGARSAIVAYLDPTDGDIIQMRITGSRDLRFDGEYRVRSYEEWDDDDWD